MDKELLKKMRAEGPSKYGSKRFGVVTPKGLIFLLADKIEITECGALLAHGGFREYHGDPIKEPIVVMAFAPGKWSRCFAASCLDGSAVAED